MRSTAAKTTSGGADSRRASPSSAKKPKAESSSPVATTDGGIAGVLASDPAARADGVLFSILANKELLLVKHNAQEAQVRYQSQRKRNEVLADELRRQDADSLSVTTHLEAEIKRLRELLQQKVLEADILREEMKDCVAVHARRYEETIEEQNATIERLARLVSEQRAELDTVALFVEERNAHLAENTRLREEVERNRKEHAEELAHLRFQTVDRRIRLQAMEEHMTENFQREVEGSARAMMASESRQLLDENAELRESAAMLSKDVVQLADMAESKQAAHTRTRLQAQLQKSANEESVRRSVRLGNTVREADQRIYNLGLRCAALQNELTQTRSELTKQHEGEVSALREELQQAKASLSMHRKELREVRKLARVVVQQRTDIERFFHCVLADVQQQKEKKWVVRRDFSARSASSSPQTNYSPTSSLGTESRRRSGQTRAPDVPNLKSPNDGIVLPSVKRMNIEKRQSAQKSASPERETDSHAAPAPFFITQPDMPSPKENAHDTQNPTDDSMERGANDSDLRATYSMPSNRKENQHASTADSDRQRSAGNRKTVPRLPFVGGQFSPQDSMSASSSGFPLNRNADDTTSVTSSVADGGIDFYAMSWDEKVFIIEALLMYVNRSAKNPGEEC